MIAAKRFVVDHPDNSAGWLLYGISLYEVARYTEALPALRRSARMTPPTHLHIVQENFGELYEQKGSFRRAEAWYRKAIVSRPLNASAYISLGSMLAREGRLREAEAIYRKATRFRHDCIEDALFDLGCVLRAQGRLVQARSCFQRALKIDPKYEIAKRALSDVTRVVELTPRVAKQSTTPLAGTNMLSPDESRKRWKVVRQFDERGRTSCTLIAAKHLLADFPKFWPCWVLYGETLYKRSRYREALAALHRAARLCPPRLLYLIQHHFGHLYKRRGKFGRAKVYYSKAIASFPSNAAAYIYLGALFAVEGRLSEAEAMHRKATRCKEGCIDEAFLNLGLILRAKQRYAEARACFQKALKIDPKYMDAKKDLADVTRAIESIRDA